MQTFPMVMKRNVLVTATDNTAVYDAVDFDLQYEANEAARLFKLRMWIKNNSPTDDPPGDTTILIIRVALLDDPNATIDLASTSAFESRPEIVVYHQLMWTCEVAAVPALNTLLKTGEYVDIDFPNGGLLVGRNMQYVAQVNENASMFPLDWQLNAELWYRKERVSDAMFKQLMYTVIN